jgi:hypothetical protein
VAIKIKWKGCAICLRRFDPDEEYLQLEVNSSAMPKHSKPRELLIRLDDDGKQTLVRQSQHWYVGGWMTTRAVCQQCVDQLPEEWQQLLSKPQLSDYIKVEKLSENPERGTEVWTVREKRRDEK